VRLLQAGKLDAPRTAIALETIERNAKLQNQLIEDLLDISRILQGKLSLDFGLVDLTSTITAAQEAVALAAEAKSIQIKHQFPADPAPVLGDSNRLQQVIWNLLTNAVKFTPPHGAIEIRLEITPPYAHIIVQDTGRGIDPEFLPYVFEYFRQADSSTTRQFGGLGLGLAIVRQIVELHGGIVMAESSGEGLGATFTVQLPVAEAASPVANPDSPSSDGLLDEAALQNQHILLVEDETDAREFVQYVLELHGATVTAVASGQEALRTFQQQTPDLLISDIGMPQMDGYDLLQKIRSVATGSVEVPAIALTAYAGEMNQQRALAAGFQLHLAKPLEAVQLIQAILTLLKP
jgi:CheY-like chemotaxis protein